MEQFVSVATGVRMEYMEHGSRGAPAVVCLHGVTDSWHSFEWVLERLPPTLHAFAVSQRGHGDSSRPAAGYRYADMSDDLLAFMDAVGLPSATIVGHSMGASVAQRFVVDHPERVSGLVLMGAFATIHRDPGLTAFYESSIAPLTDPVSPALAREWQLSTLGREMPAEALEVIVAETLKVPARVWHEAFQGFLSTPDFTSELTRASMPALLVWGDLDTYAPRSSQDRLLEVLPSARLIVYEGHGHALHWEDPGRFANDLASFVANEHLAAPSFSSVR
jgi:pimeloyl-ACP methyl ester carboxylesterase